MSGSKRSADANPRLHRSRGGPTTKFAARVADRMVDEIVSLGWPEGEVLGSEGELIERYGVSRAVFREAVRLVEHAGVARARRGPGGGLVITTPSVSSVIGAVMVYFTFAQVRLDELFEARLAVEEAIVQLAPGRLTEQGIARLRELVDAEASGQSVDRRQLHLELAALTGNPALELFVDILTRVSNTYLGELPQVSHATAANSSHAHARIVEAVIAGNEGLARRRMRRHLHAEADWLRRRRTARQRIDADLVHIGPSQPKRAEQISQEIFREIARSGWPVGELLGSEADLMARYDVSRAVLRESVRLLEHHQIAKMRRGPGGGLFVTEPGVGAITDSVALYLERRGIEAVQLAEMRRGIELACVELATNRMDDDAIMSITAALAAERTAADHEFSPTAHDLHVVIGNLTQNRVLALMVQVLARLSMLHQRGPADVGPAPPVMREVVATHEKIVEAIVSGDAELARFRMRRHLDAMLPWLR